MVKVNVICRDILENGNYNFWLKDSFDVEEIAYIRTLPAKAVRSYDGENLYKDRLSRLGFEPTEETIMLRTHSNATLCYQARCHSIEFDDDHIPHRVIEDVYKRRILELEEDYAITMEMNRILHDEIRAFHQRLDDLLGFGIGYTKKKEIRDLEIDTQIRIEEMTAEYLDEHKKIADKGELDV